MVEGCRAGDRTGAGGDLLCNFFLANRTDVTTLLFFHGGYWQRNAKEGFSFVAEGPLAHGFHVAVAGYTLAPEARMDGIVREARTAALAAPTSGDIGRRSGASLCQRLVAEPD